MLYKLGMPKYFLLLLSFIFPILYLFIKHLNVWSFLYLSTPTCLLVSPSLFLDNNHLSLSFSLFYLYPIPFLLFIYKFIFPFGECPCGVMVKALDCGIVVSRFVLQSRYYVCFQTNTLGKGMSLFFLPAIG